MSNYKFGKDKRIKGNERFKQIIAGRFCIRTEILIVFVMKNELEQSRAGFSVGKKFGNAVTRNYLKRLLREVFRLSADSLPQGYDFILMYNSRLTTMTRNDRRKIQFSQVSESFNTVINKLEKRGLCI